MEKVIREIQDVLKQNIKEGRVDFHQKIIPGSKKVFGVPNPIINSMAKHYDQYGLELVENLWCSESYEESLLAVKILSRLAKKNPEQTLALLIRFTPEIRDWAICDTLGMGVSKALYKKYTPEIFSISEKMMHSPILWERRMSLVLLEYYTRLKEHHDLIKLRVHALENDKEHYVKKAIQWLNRDLLKYG